MPAVEANRLSVPLKVGDLNLRSSNIMASLTRNRSEPDTIPNDANLEYYTQRAEGGAGLILTEGTLVSPQGTEWPYAPGIWTEEHVSGWKRITDSVHQAGGLIFCQLWHVGRVAHPDMPLQKRSGAPVIGPSAIAAQGGKFRDLPGNPGYVTPTEVQDPWTIVEEFRRSAKLAKQAGFDGAELHSANGYLPHQFLDSNSNRRIDEWGGSIENRCRLGLECLKAIIEVWGPSRVGVKINPCGGYNDMGMPLPETIATFTYYITQMSAMKLAYIQLVRYVPVMDVPITIAPREKHMEDSGHPSNPKKRGIPHDVLAVYGPLVKVPLETLRDHAEEGIRGPAMPSAEFDSRNPTPTRLFLNGGLTPSEADQLLTEGKIDAAVFGTLWISNPDLQKRVDAGMDVGGKGINDTPDVKRFYGSGTDDPRPGYTDYPPMTSHLKSKN